MYQVLAPFLSTCPSLEGGLLEISATLYITGNFLKIIKELMIPKGLFIKNSVFKGPSKISHHNNEAENLKLERDSVVLTSGADLEVRSLYWNPD